MEYRNIETITTEEIESACKRSRCFRQVNAILRVHLLHIQELARRINQDNIDTSHFNKSNVNCSKCGKPFNVMTILDFDDVGRKLGCCIDCNYSEWVEDGGDIIDSAQYFKAGHKTHTMNVIGHTNI